MKNILDKYKDVLITKDDLKKELDLTNIKNSKEMHLDNVVDLFGLSNTKFLIAYPVSTWSVFAYEYKKKKRNFMEIWTKYLLKCNFTWCPHTDSNREPIDYKSIALPIEL